MKLERTVLWAEKDLFWEDGDPGNRISRFPHGCFGENGLQTDEPAGNGTGGVCGGSALSVAVPMPRRILCGKVQMEGYCRNRRKSHVPMAFGRGVLGIPHPERESVWYLACTPWNVTAGSFAVCLRPHDLDDRPLAARVGLPERCYGVQPITGDVSLSATVGFHRTLFRSMGARPPEPDACHRMEQGA